MSGKVKKYPGSLFLIFCVLVSRAQVPDTVYLPALVTLDSFVVEDVNEGFSVADFIQYVEDDTSFYTAFQNLRRISYSGSTTARFFDKEHLCMAMYSNRTYQHVENNCRWMDFNFEVTNGDFFDDDDQMRYFTAKMFSYIFLYHDTICNRIAETDNNLGADNNLEKRKEQLKVLIFNPGKPVEGIPVIKNKMAIFDQRMVPYYDYSIARKRYDTGIDCYVFTVKKKADVKNEDVVIKELTTWFDKRTLDIVARQYVLSYNAGVFAFDVQMQVKLATISGLRVPEYIYYNGDWDIPGKKPERGSVQIFVEK